MTFSLLTTKLHIPTPRPDLVSRPRLIEQLNTYSTRKLTLVSAPAGFGKSTLLSTCIQQIESGTRVAWLSLDEGDNDLTRFLTYFVAALQTIGTNIGQGALAALQSLGSVNTEAVLTNLLNEIANFPGDIVLILDDYHVIETPEIDQAITFFLEHLPTQMHLVIASRIDPTLPLSRLRVRRQMAEIRADDLRFTPEETAVFLNQVTGFNLSSQEVSSLELRTEGWIAGLQLAALSLQGFDRDSEVTAFINRFTGNDRYIQDYLADEVLQQQTQETKDFLLHTSILNRMSASLCDTVTEKQNCQAVLDGLENANLFIVPLDNERRWFRYHHLFADLLYHRLTQTYPERIEKLHARASQWLEENGFQNQAIKHALAMEEKHLAADLIEKHALTFLYQGSIQVKAMLNWFDQLTEKVIRERPLLHIYKAWTLVFENPFKNKATVEQILSRVQGLLANIELSHSIERSVTGHIASIRGLLSQPPIQTDHDPHQVLALFQEAIRLFPPDEVKIRCNIHIGIAYEYMHLENTEAALKANQNAFTEAQSANNHLVAVVALRNQAMIKYYQGKLTQAVDLCQKEIFSFDQRDTLRNYPIPSLAILSIAKGYLLAERGELEKAETELAKGFETLQLYNEYETISLGHIAMSRLLLLKGETDKARQTIELDKQRQPTQTTLLNVLSVQVALSCFENKSGALETIQNWARENQPQLEMEANFQGITPWAETRHLAHLTWIQAQIVLSRQETISSYKSVLLSCLDYLDQRLQTAEQNGINFRVVECLVLKVLVLDVMGKSKDATDMLSQALSLAAPKGFCRVFLDKGQPMVQLLKGVSVQDYSIGFAHQLLAAFERLGDAKLSLLQQNMAEPLSEREQEVLQLVAQGLTNREISERLYLALDTVKGHNRRVFGKLGVQNRTEAVTCARELGILQTTDSK